MFFWKLFLVEPLETWSRKKRDGEKYKEKESTEATSFDLRKHPHPKKNYSTTKGEKGIKKHLTRA